MKEEFMRYIDDGMIRMALLLLSTTRKEEKEKIDAVQVIEKVFEKTNSIALAHKFFKNLVLEKQKSVLNLKLFFDQEQCLFYLQNQDEIDLEFLEKDAIFNGGKELEDFLFRNLFQETRFVSKIKVSGALEDQIKPQYLALSSQKVLSYLFLIFEKKEAVKQWIDFDREFPLTKESIPKCLEHWSLERVITRACHFPKLVKWMMKHVTETNFFCPKACVFLNQDNPDVLAEWIYLYRDAMIPYPTSREKLQDHLLNVFSQKGLRHLRNLAYFLPKTFPCLLTTTKIFETCAPFHLKRDAPFFFYIVMALEDVNVFRDAKGNTLLHLFAQIAKSRASFWWNMFLSKYLVDNTKDLLQKNAAGKTAYDVFPDIPYLQLAMRRQYRLKISTLKRRLLSAEKTRAAQTRVEEKSKNFCSLCELECSSSSLFCLKDDGRVVCEKHANIVPIL